MYISAFNNKQNTYYLRAPKGSVLHNSPSFTAAKKLPPLEFCPADFFVHIKGYGKNYPWAEEMKKTADLAVEEIKDPESRNVNPILINIAKRVREANQHTYDIKKRRYTGVLRTTRVGYGQPCEWASGVFFTQMQKRFTSYLDRFGKTIDTPLKSPYPDIDLTRPKGSIINPEHMFNIVYGDSKYINNALNRVGGTYFNLKTDYILNPKNIKNENLEDINSRIAEMRWIIAHATPWERGSDAIGNVFTRALYKSMGIKTSPLKKGVSLDLEAFCTPLDEYKKNFSTFFETPPYIVGK